MKDKNYGGKRAGAGRKPKVYPSVQEFYDELFYPAIHAALKEDRDDVFSPWRRFRISATEIRMVYGAQALALFKDIFTVTQRGGCTRAQEPFNSQWELNLGSVVLAQHLLKQCGKSTNDLDDLGCPTPKMKARVDAIRDKRAMRALDKAGQIY